MHRSTGGDGPHRRQVEGGFATKRALFVAALAGALLLALAGPSGAQEASDGCSPFELTQTYTDWGPADHYGRTVTVHYEAPRCTVLEGATAHLELRGTAAVHPGRTTLREPIEVRPFRTDGTWTDPANPEGWPPSWWSCDVTAADYTWEIPGVYSFVVSARQGTWSLEVTTGDGPSLSWQHDGCGTG